MRLPPAIPANLENMVHVLHATQDVIVGQVAGKRTALQQFGPQAEAWLQTWLAPVTATPGSLTQAGQGNARRLRGMLINQPGLLQRPAPVQKRGMASLAAQDDFGQIDNRLVRLPDGVPPFQLPAECTAQAKHIVLVSQQLEPGVNAGPGASVASPLTSPRSVGMPSQWISLIRSISRDNRFRAEPLSSHEQLLALYQRHGPLVLRGPELDDVQQQSGYPWHAIAIMAAVRLRLNDGQEHIVLYAFDCNDRGKDEETSAARDKAASLSRAMYELTFPDIVEMGCDGRRIRLIEAGSMMASIQARTADIRKRGGKSQFDAMYIAGGEPILDKLQTTQLEEAIAGHWGEVEIYPPPA